MEIKRNEDGTIKGITTMGDLIEKSDKKTERDEKKEKYDKKWSNKKN